MFYRLAADFVLVLHLAFVLFVALGWLAVLRWPRLAWAHVPAVAWGVAISVGQWVCPLTPVEVALRGRGGEAGYEGSFIAHYLLPLIYPAGLTPVLGRWIALVVAATNLAAWAWLWRHRAGNGRADDL